MKTPPGRWMALLLICLAVAGTGMARHADTTCSTTRVVKKDNAHSRDQSTTVTYVDETDECERSFGEAFSDALAGFFVNLLGEAFKVSFGWPCAHLFAGQPEMPGWRAEPIRHEIGIGFGTSYMYNLAVGMPVKLFYSPLVLAGNHVGLRENVALCAVPSVIYRDFSRDLFVDGAMVGTQVDVTHSYAAAEIPILTELLFFPSGRDGSFYWMIGAGPQYRYERVKASRQLNGQTSPIHVINEEWIPKVAVGIGRYGAFSRTFGDFSIRYEAAINRNKRTISTPGDNSRIEHSFTFNWSIAFW